MAIIILSLKMKISKQSKFKGNPAHLRRLLNAIETKKILLWNQWRKDHPRLKPNLQGINLEGLNLGGINFENANLSDSSIARAHLWQGRLRGANLQRAYMDEVQLNYGDLRKANLNFSRLVSANLNLVQAQGASFRSADLSHSILNGIKLQGADLREARISGTSIWGIAVDSKTKQKDLIVDDLVDPLEDLVDYPRVSIENIVMRVNNIEAANFLYLITADNSKLKVIIDSLTDSVVLILGNFGPDRMIMLQTIKRELSRLRYAPIIFNFDTPNSRDLIETISLLAGFSRFIIADITDPKSTPLESMLLAPQLMVPFASVIQNEPPFSMFESLRIKYEWILPTISYRNKNDLRRQLKRNVVEPCEKMIVKLNKKRHSFQVSEH